jgi:peptidoglycan/xylan/chitin deacetylase (PgdA/CDA1 family)
MIAMFRSLPVLMYHSISPQPSDTNVAPEIFEKHCAALAGAGWRALSLAEAEAYFLEDRLLPFKSCLMTFDDGYWDNWLIAAPLLERYGLRGAIFPVLSLLEKEEGLRAPESAPAAKPLIFRMGQRVREERFCSVAELCEMARRGTLTPAPHSLRHERVAVGPKFRGLLRPGRERGWFSMPAYGVVWGMPDFVLGHALTTRAFWPSEELLHLARTTVPQPWEEARNWLAEQRNRAALMKRIRALEARGLLGRMESEDEYRARLAEEFAACRKQFAGLFGVSPVSFCWPWGDYNAAALEEARNAGFRVFFSTELGNNSPASALAVKRFKVFEITGSRLTWETAALSIAPLAKLAGKWQDRRAA